MRLYRLLQPNHYDVHLTLQRQQRAFAGTVTVQAMVMQNADAVYLHARELQITSATIDGASAKADLDDNDILKLSVPNLKPGEHTIRIAFSGTITDPMHGLYPCYFTLDEQPHELLATQFESHHAREVFPCVDEPVAKATFALTLTTETGVTALSNTPVANQIERDNTLITSFQTTPSMSTYLLAWVVGKLTYQEAITKDGVIIRAYATPANHHKLGHALNAAVECLEYLNDYFDLPYPLPKCDLVALPDFSSGAMENWGCITFRESTMLVDEHSSTRTKQYVTMVVAHELAHQWFGNLVTMRWWNDLWLNESFANFMEYLVPDRLHPEWRLMIQLYEDETTHAFERDTLPSVQKIQQEVRSPEEIEGLFDPAIVYAKGGSLLNMLNAYLGEEVFREGLRLYLKRHQFTNTEANNLWAALSEASGRDVAGFMQPWITQSGLPIVSVGVAERTVNLHQRRFIRSPRQTNPPDQTTWPIPLLASQPLGNDLLLHPSTTAAMAPSNQPLLLNQGRTGYYVTQYNQDHAMQLAQEVRSNNLDVIDRLGLLNDALATSEAGLQPYDQALTFLESYTNEASQPVWGAISRHITALKMFAGNDEDLLTALRKFVAHLARPQHERLGWQEVANESHFDTLLRPIIIGHLAYAEDPHVVSRLNNIVEQAAEPSAVPADLRAVAFACAVYNGDEATFQKLLHWHGSTTSAEQRTQLVAGLCAARSPQLIERTLSLLTTDAVRLQDVFYWINYLCRNRFALGQTWQWLQENWGWIVQNYARDFHYTYFVKYPSLAFATAEQLHSFTTFFTPMLSATPLSRTISQGIEDIDSRMQWLQRDKQAVVRYLRTWQE